jgi:hypothetical protein
MAHSDANSKKLLANNEGAMIGIDAIFGYLCKRDNSN